MKHTTKRKLALHPETLRSLRLPELRGAHGGSANPTDPRGGCTGSAPADEPKITDPIAAGCTVATL